MIIQSVIGSSFQFAPPLTGDALPGALPGIANETVGLVKRHYPGYHGDDMAFFDTAVPDDTSIDYTTLINNTGTDYYSVVWTGYFKVPSTGIYRFNISSDDGSYLWMGNNTISGFTTSNAIINNGGGHGITGVNSGYYQLYAGDYYPIRLVFGEIGGGDYMQFFYELNGSGNFINSGFDLFFVYNNATEDGF